MPCRGKKDFCFNARTKDEFLVEGTVEYEYPFHFWMLLAENLKNMGCKSPNAL